MGLQESNLNWSQIPVADQWEERVLGWWESRDITVKAYNTQEVIQTAVQPGGCMLVSANKAKPQVKECGVDESGLGRWAWTRYQGRENFTIRVISAYRCGSTAGPTTVYSQQRRYFDMHQDPRHPREIMMEDLCTAIEKWKDEGDQIVLLIDANENVGQQHISNTFAEVGLREAILEKHEESLGQTPTHQRGSEPIDGIFISETLQISSGGYLPFGEAPSDHRALWIKIDMNVAFGYVMPDVIHPSARRMKNDDPRVQKRFIADYEKWVLKHSLHTRSYALQQQVDQGQWNDQMADEYEDILRIRTKGIEVADKKCRKLKMGEVPWSRTIQSARDEIRLWKAVVSWKRGTKVNTRFISRLEKQTSTTNSLRITLGEAENRLKESYKRYYELKKDADSLRESWLQDLAAIKAKENNGNQQVHYNLMLSRERQRRASRRLKRILGKNHAGGLTKVTEIQEDGLLVEYDKKDDIENACHKENRSKFTQTNDTPAMQGQLAEDLGYLGTSEACQRILEGTYTPPPGTDIYTCEYLRELARPPLTHHPPQAQISTQTFQSGWKKMKEFTSAGISGIHFGHMKACAESTLLSDFEATLCHIPYASGYSPLEWQTSVNNMIEKKGKGNLVSGLRTINLMEASFNFNNKVMGRDALHCAEHNNLLPKEQYGSRKAHQANSQTANKCLLYNLAALQRRPIMLCSNDAKSCYDRMVHSIASLAMQRWGMPKQPVRCMIITIQQMDHYIRTAFGNSTTTLAQNEDEPPFQGILQGNGSGPTLWLSVSSPLLEMMRNAGHGVTFKTPLSLEMESFVGFAFVDDTDVAEGDLRWGTIDIDEVFDAMQQSIDRWEGGLKATGGAIRPDKSFVYPISFTWDPAGKCRYEKVEDMDRELTVKNHEGEREPLELVDANVGKETLGICLAPDGNMKDEIKHLEKKIKLWTSNIKTGRIPSNEAFSCISSTIMKTLEYPLVATTFTMKECRKLVRPIHNAAFPHAKLCRTLPYAVRYGAKDSLGLGLDDLYISQGLEKLVFYYEEINSTSMSGPLLRANLEWSLIHLGVGDKGLFQIDYHAFGHLLPRTWLKSLWEFTDKYQIEIPPTQYILKPKRVNDKFLMVEFYNKGYKNSDLEKLNRCRMYLQVTTLSDIVDGTGDQLCRQYYSGDRDPYRFKEHEWPEQSKPNDAAWQIWRQALRRCFPKEEGVFSKLVSPLGYWIDEKKDKWKWFYSPQVQKMYTKSPVTQRWKVYQRVHRHGPVRKTNLFQYETTALILPNHAQRATVKRDFNNHNRFRITGWAKDHTYQEATIQQQEEQRCSWMELHSSNEPYTNFIVQQLAQNQPIMIVSDGSYHPDHKVGTASWVITSANNTARRIHGHNIVPGERYLQCSHRSELSGIIGAIRHISRLCATHNIEQGQVELGCDGMEAYKVATRYHYRPSTRISHFDLVSTMHKMLLKSPLKWKFRHVKGHQDDNINIENIDIWGQLNMVADANAKVALWEHIAEGGNIIQMNPLEKTMAPVRCSYSGEQITIVSHLKKRLRNHIARTTSMKYWKEKGKQLDHENCDRESFAHAARNVPLHRQRWLAKWSCGICGVGVWLERWKDQPHSKCPRCLTDNETVDHVIHCQHEGATLCWNTGIEELKVWMSQNNSIPGLAEAVGLRLTQWRDNQPLPDIPTTDETVRDLIQAQDSLGWDALCFGAVHDLWSKEQGDYLEALGRRTTGVTWISRFIRKLWDLQHKMWLHRNSCVHNEGKTVHQHEEEALNRAIQEEFVRGRDGLTQEYGGLFRGNAETLVSKDAATRIRWLSHVWAGRDRLREEEGLDPEWRDYMATAFIGRNSVRRKRKRGIG